MSPVSGQVTAHLKQEQGQICHAWARQPMSIPGETLDPSPGAVWCEGLGLCPHFSFIFCSARLGCVMPPISVGVPGQALIDVV